MMDSIMSVLPSAYSIKTVASVFVQNTTHEFHRYLPRFLSSERGSMMLTVTISTR